MKRENVVYLAVLLALLGAFALVVTAQTKSGVEVLRHRTNVACGRTLRLVVPRRDF